ncbi:Glutamyl-tRNA(Gln) amidotransferase subunit A [Periweissella fabaria]|uniref:Glutamyl-tRNA(Gln) amidotransferase subunit A n=1 Tax=Periweissella fabaria TaxID=546157 RepID=A0ABM8Z9D7_9LACO|nr:Glutamyl-tRNA(Gln) amidotransferase subunit A [Periweissella fabaria]
MNYFETDLVTLHQQLVAKKISAVELTEQTLARINATDDKLKAYILVTKEHALEQAAAIDAQGINPNSLFSGIPVAIKDNILTKDIITTGASKMLQNYQPSYDATVVKK